MSVRRRGNGLTAQSYVLLLDIDPRLSGQLLTALASAGVAAYATPSVGRTDPFLQPQAPTRLLEAVHVDATRRPDARRVLEATMPDATAGLPSVEEEDQFAALVAGWDEEPEGHPWPNSEDVEPPRRRKTDRPRPNAEPPRGAPEQPQAPTDQAAPPGTSPEREAAIEAGPAPEPGAVPSSDASTDAPPTSLTKPDQNGREAGPDPARPGRGTAQDGTQQDGTQQDGTQQDGTQQDATQEPKAAADEVEDDPDDAEGHFVRPPLAPLPPSHPVTKWGLVALGLGLLLLIFPTLVGLEHTTAVDLVGVLCIIGAVGLLVSRLSSRSTDDYEGPDDGAVV